MLLLHALASFHARCVEARPYASTTAGLLLRCFACPACGLRGPHLLPCPISGLDCLMLCGVVPDTAAEWVWASKWMHDQHASVSPAPLHPLLCSTPSNHDLTPSPQTHHNSLWQPISHHANIPLRAAFAAAYVVDGVVLKADNQSLAGAPPACSCLCCAVYVDEQLHHRTVHFTVCGACSWHNIEDTVCRSIY